MKTLLAPMQPESPESLCDRAILEWPTRPGCVWPSCALRLEQIHLDAGYYQCHRQGKQGAWVLPVGSMAVGSAGGRYLQAGRPRLVDRAIAGQCLLAEKRGTPFAAGHPLAAHQAASARLAGIAD
jgi:site-specific recombinase XerD